MTRKPKPIGRCKTIIATTNMGPRWPAGSRVTFDLYRLDQLERWACGSDACFTLAGGVTLFLRIARMTPARSVTAFSLTPKAGEMSEIVILWSNIVSFAVAFKIVDAGRAVS